jgi:hypothetical protein
MRFKEHPKCNQDRHSHHRNEETINDSVFPRVLPFCLGPGHRAFESYPALGWNAIYDGNGVLVFTLDFRCLRRKGAWPRIGKDA